jgi:hypothetical protein
MFVRLFGIREKGARGKTPATGHRPPSVIARLFGSLMVRTLHSPCCWPFTHLLSMVFDGALCLNVAFLVATQGHPIAQAHILVFFFVLLCHRTCHHSAQ